MTVVVMAFVLGRAVTPKLCTSEPISSVQPSTSTNSMILKGSDTITGDIIIMPIDISTEATTMSGMMTKG